MKIRLPPSSSRSISGLMMTAPERQGKHDRSRHDDNAVRRVRTPGYPFMQSLHAFPDFSDCLKKGKKNARRKF
jgi:hypothetical protein